MAKAVSGHFSAADPSALRLTPSAGWILCGERNIDAGPALEKCRLGSGAIAVRDIRENPRGLDLPTAATAPEHDAAAALRAWGCHAEPAAPLAQRAAAT
jgi:hypothetical protein